MRRAFRRQVRRTFAPDVPPILQRANNLFDKGEYERAAEAYEQIASAAELRNGPRAPFFFLQAGRSRVLAGQTAAGMEHLKHGLSLFAARGLPGRVFNAGNRVVSELNQLGLKKEAGEIGALVKSLLPAQSNFAHTAGLAGRPVLPTHCPSCGASVRLDEVEWLDNLTAECAYCGSPVRGEA